MKYDLQKLRELYVKKLTEEYRDKSKSLNINRAIGLLDDVISSINSSQDAFIDRLVSDERFVHHCYGKSKSDAFTSYPHKGSFNAHPNFGIGHFGIEYNSNTCETFRDKVWTSTEIHSEPDFKTRLLGRKIGTSYIFELHYLDSTHDNRKGNNVRYALLIPHTEIKSIVPHIAANPSVLIDIYRKAYKGHDNSEKDGRTNIIIDLEHSEIKDIPQ